METNGVDSNMNSTATKPVYRSPIGVIFDKFAKYKDVSLVYGEPIELENKKVLPMAKINYYVGGGGYISVKPLGVYEITSDKVKFKPAIDLQFILIIITVCTFGLAKLLKPCKKK